VKIITSALDAKVNEEFHLLPGIGKNEPQLPRNVSLSPSRTE